MRTHPLIHALQIMLPEAGLAITASRDWCSMTFSGQRLAIECVLAGSYYDKYYRYLCDILPEHEFSLSGCLVADIAVVAQENSADGTKVMIEALVING